MRPVLIFLACAFGAGCSFHVDGLGDSADLGAFLIDGGLVPARDFAGSAVHDLAQAPPVVLDLAPPTDLAGPYLRVSGVSSPPSIDLTAEGTLDWAHWGFTIASDFDRKATGNNQISNYSTVGPVLASQYSDSAVTYQWTDGESGIGQRASSNGPTKTGVYAGGIGNGFSLTAPADQTPRHLRLYVGGYKVTGQIKVTLSDGAAAMYMDHSYGSINDSFNVVYDVEYEAGSPNQKLQLSWTAYAGEAFGNVTLQSATLLAP